MNLIITLLLLLSRISNITAGNEYLITSYYISLPDEQLWVDRCNHAINSWLFDDNISYNQRFRKIDSLIDFSIKRYKLLSISNAYFTHKKGALYQWKAYSDASSFYDSAINYYKIALSIRLQLNEDLSDNLINDIITGYTMIGICYSLKGDPYSSIKFVEKGINILDGEKIDSNNFLNYLDLSIQAARTFTILGDYDQALNYYSKIINFPVEKIPKVYIKDALIWRISAQIELAGLKSNKLYSPKEAVRILAKVNSTLDSPYLSNDVELMASFYNKKGISFYRLNMNDSALLFYSKALTLYKTIDEHKSIADNLMNKGITFTKLSLLDSARIYLDSASAFIQRLNYKERLPYIYENYGDLAIADKKFIKGVEHYNTALSYLISGFLPKNVWSNPGLTSESYITDKIITLRILSYKATTFRHLYRINHEFKNLKESYISSNLANQVIGLMRSEFQAEASRMSLASYAKPIYEQGIEACYLLYQLQPHDSLLNKAFEFAEKSKAIVLLDAVRKTNARAHVAPELIQAEKTMNLKVNYFEKQAALYEQDSSNRVSYNVYDSLLYYRRQRQDAVDQIRETTPEYYSLTFDQATTSPTTIQQNLSKDHAFVEYFLGDSSLYTFTITEDTTLFLKYDQPDAIKNWVNNWTASIRGMDMDYLYPSYQLYSALIEPVKKYVDLPEKLIIVPDEVLNLVNYEVLTSELPSNERIYLPTFDKYLIYDHQVSYAFSASTLVESNANHQKINKRYLGIAPPMNEGFYWDDNWFDKLDYNQEEVLQAASLFSRKDIIESASSKDQFMKMAPDHGLIHCATHAMANNSDGDLSYIIFGKDETDVIYAKDLYALDLNADLVVLSACQTSAGELNRGEGIISLARSFTYAGAAAVVTSLWNVREKANKEIIYDFYSLLKKGKPKDEALRSAKLNFLKNINRDDHMDAHPYFWATMVVIGDTSPIQTTVSMKLIITAFVILLFVVALYLRYQKRRTKSQSS